MSSRAPGILRRILKWVVFPLVLAAVGVFAVGPYLNKVGVPIVENLKPKPGAKVVPVEEQGDEQGRYGAPKVEVTVAPGSTHLRTHEGASRSSSRHRRRRRHKHKPAATPARTAPDDGSAPPPPPGPSTPG